MKVIFTRDCKVDGKKFRAKQRAEFPDDLAKSLIRMGRCAPADKPAPRASEGAVKSKTVTHSAPDADAGAQGETA